jgi:threonine dehydrogenase-like Zn-dependent dehydrogenase
VSDYNQLVGDYTNPILQPWAAAVVKKFGEMSLAGITYGNPSNQCWPMPMLFVYKEGTIRMIQQPDMVQIIYTGPNTDAASASTPVIPSRSYHAVLVRGFGWPL